MISLLSSPDYRSLLLHGTSMTLRLFATSWVLAMVTACVLAALRTSGSKTVRTIVSGFVDYHRNVPGVVQIFVWYFGIPQLLPSGVQRLINAHDGEFILSCAALTLYASAYMSEDLRSGFRSVAAGQREAADALGLSRIQTLAKVLLPQALRIALPPLVNQTLALFKATSLAMTVGVVELLSVTTRIENETFRTFEVFGIASACYLAFSWSIMAAGYYASRRLTPARAHS